MYYNSLINSLFDVNPNTEIRSSKKAYIKKILIKISFHRMLINMDFFRKYCKTVQLKMIRLFQRNIFLSLLKIHQERNHFVFKKRENILLKILVNCFFIRNHTNRRKTFIFKNILTTRVIHF